MPRTQKTTHSARRDWMIGIIIVLITLLGIFWLATRPSRARESNTISFTSHKGKVGIVQLAGLIYDSRRMVKQFERLAEEKSVKAIVFRIDSQGGLVGASQEIYQAVCRAREKKPIVVSMGNVAASGGYYVACGADTIVANPGTTTGSIGVMAEFVNVEGLLKKLGIRWESIKSGKFKDTGAPYRDMTNEDRAYLQSWIGDAYNQFVEVVAKERKLPREKVLEIADGRVFTGKQAKTLGLVDVLGDYQDAIRIAAQLGHIKGEPELVKWRERRMSWLELLFQETEGMLHRLGGMHLLYWAGGW